MIERQRKIRPIFRAIPKWLGAYRGHGLTANSPEFHYYSAREDLSQPVTLYITENNVQQPIKMYYNVQHFAEGEKKEKDESPLVEYKNLDRMEKEEHQKIQISKEDAIHDSSWVRKFEPTRFIDLLTDELINRNVLTWIKSWDEIVFKKKVPKADNKTISTFFKRGQSHQSNHNKWFMGQDYNYKKLILLAGPPGCGKTTLARVVARHSGYHYEEINASDDRSGKTLINKIDNLVTNHTVGREQKPVCVIIDEVDGALDSDSNGLKEVLTYIETGIKPGEVVKKIEKKDKEKEKEGKKESKKGQYTKFKTQGKQEPEQEQRKTKIDRPVIFICNDPFVRGLKELRGKAIVVFFNQLQEDRVVRRLKEITELEGIYIERQLLIKICQMCNNDVRSSVGVLQMVVRFQKQQKISPRDMLSRLKLSLSKDTITSSNQFMQRLNSSKSVQKAMFKDYKYYLEQHANPSLLFTTFFHNLQHHKNIYFKLETAGQLYRQMVAYDLDINRNHGQVDQFSSLVYCLFKSRFKSDQVKKVEFPSAHFERMGKMKNHQDVIDRVIKEIPPALSVFYSRDVLVSEIFYLFWLTMQTGSTREEDVLKCVYIMITYGIKLAPRGSPNFFNPEFDQLLVFGQNRPNVSFSNTTRNMMEENYQFLKMKNQLLADSISDGRQNYQTVINQLKRNRRRNRQLQGGGAVKYKFLEGTGTEIKYDLKIGNFFQNRKI